MIFDTDELGAGVVRSSLLAFFVVVAFVVYLFSWFDLLGYVCGAVVSFVYFLMLKRRVSKVEMGKKGLAYMIRGLILRLIFIILAAAVLIRVGFGPLAVLLGLLVTPVGNKLFALYLTIKGLRELRGGNNG